MKINNRNLSDNETTQDVPMILNPELRDVFRIFVSMLDIKSFMRLAMTSKDMYKRCMEDKAIRINVDEDHVFGINSDEFRFKSSVVSDQHIERYLAALRRIPCTLSLRSFEIGRNMETLPSMDEIARQYLADIRVKKIEKLCLCNNFIELDTIIPFINDFHVNALEIRNMRVSLPFALLRSLLQLNLKEFSYDKPLSVDFLFEINSTIPKLYFTGIHNIPKDKFMHILWMIQTGSFSHLFLHVNVVYWRANELIPIHVKQKLPDDRPLIFGSGRCEYWFLHWQGDVTKCVAHYGSLTLELFKCEPNDFPAPLRKEEDIMKDLTEERSGFYCFKKQFPAYTAKFPLLGPLFEGPLPTERPLYFKVYGKDSFWRLDENDNLRNCKWKNGYLTWKAFSPYDPTPFGHPVLAKYIFWKLLKENTDSPFAVHCDSEKEFKSWFEGYKPYNGIGPFPHERPVVFSEKDSTCRSVLFDGFRFVCTFKHSKVNVKHYSAWERPIRITAKVINEMLQNTSRRFGNGYVNIPVDLDAFHDGLKLFESSPCDPLVRKWTHCQEDNGKLIEECWYYVKGAIMKVVWEDGRLVRTLGDLRDFPIEITKALVKGLARKATEGTMRMNPLFLTLDQFHNCFDQFTIVPFDYSGPLKNDSPLAFMKEEIRHACHNRNLCQCSEVFIRVWLLWEDMKSSYCTWGEKTPHRIAFFNCRDNTTFAPPVLKSKEYLQTLLELRYAHDSHFEWFGSVDDFLGAFDSFKKIPFTYDRALPVERPLVVEDDSNPDEPVRMLLREDDSVVKCTWSALLKCLSLS